MPDGDGHGVALALVMAVADGLADAEGEGFGVGDGVGLLVAVAVPDGVGVAAGTQVPGDMIVRFAGDATLPPPSSRSRRMPNSFASFASTLATSILVLPPKRYETFFERRNAR